MAYISSTTVYTLKLSDDEYRIILRSLSRTAFTEEELTLHETLLNELPAGELFSSDDEYLVAAEDDEYIEPPHKSAHTDFKEGDSVVLLKDMPSYFTVGDTIWIQAAPDDRHRGLEAGQRDGGGVKEGGVFEVREVYENGLLVAKHGTPFGQIISKEHFVLEQPAPKFEDVEGVFHDQFSTLLDRFSRGD